MKSWLDYSVRFDFVRWLKRLAIASLLSMLFLLPVPALIAPHVSDDPVHWAYRAYHPFMYRYPAIFGAHTTLDLRTRSGVDQSIEVLRLMIRYW